MRFDTPEGMAVRYDYHSHPRGVSAVLVKDGRIEAVGFAKFNPNDSEFRMKLGCEIAEGRALARYHKQVPSW